MQMFAANADFYVRRNVSSVREESRQTTGAHTLLPHHPEAAISASFTEWSRDVSLSGGEQLRNVQRIPARDSCVHTDR